MLGASGSGTGAGYESCAVGSPHRLSLSGPPAGSSDKPQPGRDAERTPGCGPPLGRFANSSHAVRTAPGRQAHRDTGRLGAKCRIRRRGADIAEVCGAKATAARDVSGARGVCTGFGGCRCRGILGSHTCRWRLTRHRGYRRRGATHLVTGFDRSSRLAAHHHDEDGAPGQGFALLLDDAHGRRRHDAVRLVTGLGCDVRRAQPVPVRCDLWLPTDHRDVRLHRAGCGCWHTATGCHRNSCR